MALNERQALIQAIEAVRERNVVCLCNFDRECEPAIPGLSMNIDGSVKEAMYRVLRETMTGAPNPGIDLFLYTRGGDINAVWPIVNLIREFDPDFEVLVPFRCHSSGTLLALGANRIIMAPIAELSPIDPTCANQFNPRENTARKLLGISVEDVSSYREFIRHQLQIGNEQQDLAQFAPFLMKIVNEVHPLALGNVHRVLQQIKQLAEKLLNLHAIEHNVGEIVTMLTSRFYSHNHSISPLEAAEIIGADRVSKAEGALADSLDGLLRQYENDFELRKKFFLQAHMGDQQNMDVRFIAGAAESRAWSYLFETRAHISQHSVFPQNVQIQIPPGQPMPLVPGLPRELRIEPISEGWVRNAQPKGVTK